MECIHACYTTSYIYRFTASVGQTSARRHDKSNAHSCNIECIGHAVVELAARATKHIIYEYIYIIKIVNTTRDDGNDVDVITHLACNTSKHDALEKQCGTKTRTQTALEYYQFTVHTRQQQTTIAPTRSVTLILAARSQLASSSLCAPIIVHSPNGNEPQGPADRQFYTRACANGFVRSAPV